MKACRKFLLILLASLAVFPGCKVPKGELAVVTNPGQAAVFLDGEKQSVRTNCVLNVEEGRHRIKLRHYNYEDFDTTVSVVRKMRTILDVDLKPAGEQTETPSAQDSLQE
ncbi:PEGA domain-containing protein [candidate division WOR-3 bacterium]|nr:PEGA domain-containing protein [candidate division WOR-3 bacterium]